MASDEASEERSQEKVDAAAAEGDDAKEAPVPERVRYVFTWRRKRGISGHAMYGTRCRRWTGCLAWRAGGMRSTEA